MRPVAPLHSLPVHHCYGARHVEADAQVDLTRMDIRASPTAGSYFHAVNFVASMLDSYTPRCALFFSTESAKLQRERRRKKCSSTRRFKLHSAALAQNNIHTLLCIQQDQILK
jgi:hypothetical protein